MSDLALRVLTALIGAPVVLVLLYLGGWPFGILVLAAALISQHELYGMMELGGLRPQKEAGLLIGALLVLRALVPFALSAAVVLVLLLIALNPFHTSEDRPLESLGATLFGAIYPSALFAFLLDLRLARGPFVLDMEAFYLALLTLLLIWTTDTFAYFVGKNFGRHPLAPSVSPKKTWEGSVGGALGAVLAAVALKGFLGEEFAFLAWPHIIVLALICGVLSQLGDLAESKLKRSVGAKDSGTILPGHGGLLDRFDALILAAPLVYLYLYYVAGLFE